MTIKVKRNIWILFALIVINVLGYLAAKNYFNQITDSVSQKETPTFNMFSTTVKILQGFTTVK